MSNNMVFLWAVTAVVWLGTLAYVVTLVRRQTRLTRELNALEKTVRELSS